MILDPIATPDISQNDVYIVDSNIPIENLLGGHPDDVRYFVFANDSIFESNSDIKLQAGVNFQGKVGDTLVLLYDGIEWLEMSRSLNPLYAGGSLNDYTLDSGYILNEINNLKNQVSLINQQLDKIGATDINTTVNIDPSMSTLEIQSLIDGIKPTLLNGIKVKFLFADGVYNITSPLDFRRFNGDGKVEITATSFSNIPTETLPVVLDSHSIETPVFRLFNCSCDIDINGLDVFYRTASVPSSLYNYGGIVAIGSSKVNINQCFVHTDTDHGSGIYYEKSGGIVNCTYTNRGKIGINATNMSRISINNSLSNDTAKPLYGIAASKGSVINLWDNNSPSGSNDNASTEDGGRIYS